MSTNVISNKKLSVKVQTLGGLIAIVCAVALPQLFHVMGAASGLGTSLGETFLPMHLPIILAGLLLGPYAAAVAGAASPLISFLLTGMPGTVMLPFMCIELCAYGLAAGLMRNVKMPTLGKVVIAQIAGRAARALAIVLGANVFGSAINVSVIWTSITVGVFGLALQWVIIPLAVYRAKRGE